MQRPRQERQTLRQISDDDWRRWDIEGIPLVETPQVPLSHVTHTPPVPIPHGKVSQEVEIQKPNSDWS